MKTALVTAIGFVVGAGAGWGLRGREAFRLQARAAEFEKRPPICAPTGFAQLAGTGASP